MGPIAPLAPPRIPARPTRRPPSIAKHGRGDRECPPPTTKVRCSVAPRGATRGKPHGRARLTAKTLLVACSRTRCGGFRPPPCRSSYRVAEGSVTVHGPPHRSSAEVLPRPTSRNGAAAALPPPGPPRPLEDDVVHLFLLFRRRRIARTGRGSATDRSVEKPPIRHDRLPRPRADAAALFAPTAGLRPRCSVSRRACSSVDDPRAPASPPFRSRPEPRAAPFACRPDEPAGRLPKPPARGRRPGLGRSKPPAGEQNPAVGRGEAARPRPTGRARAASESPPRPPALRTTRRRGPADGDRARVVACRGRVCQRVRRRNGERLEYSRNRRTNPPATEVAQGARAQPRSEPPRTA